ncbi:hypothetical protein ACIPYQ_37180 [Streptomyces sp. NPDC090045]|uniref:hypothetical protein n=1 Tax=Streptomyces sp. NPDC090045 TaxID=3365927 RepID=UPI00381FB365
MNKFDKDKAASIAALLLKDQKWRMRAVERIDLTSANWCERRRSVHAKELESVLLPSGLVSGRNSMRLYLPIGSFHKGPLLDFNVRVAEEPAFLLPRAKHSRIHVKYLRLLAADAAVEMDAGIEPLLVAIFGFASNPWEVFLQSEVRPSQGVINSLLCKYLERYGLPGWNAGPINITAVESWRSSVEMTKGLVRDRAPENMLSAAENPILALPHMSVTVPDAASVLALLADLNIFLAAVLGQVASKDDTKRKAASRLLDFYASSGSHWSAIVDCTVSLSTPFMIKTSERRGLNLDSSFPMKQRSSKQLVAFNDARSNHVSVRVIDMNVELASPTVLDENSEPIDLTPDFKRATPELLSFYDANPDRPNRIWLHLPLKSSLPARVSRLVVLTLTATALIAFCFFVFNWLEIGGTQALTGADIAVILVPSAIAASLLIVREVSTLSTEINKGWTLATGGLLLLLWLATLIAYGLNGIDWGE